MSDILRIDGYVELVLLPTDFDGNAAPYRSAPGPLKPVEVTFGPIRATARLVGVPTAQWRDDRAETVVRLHLTDLRGSPNDLLEAFGLIEQMEVERS